MGGLVDLASLTLVRAPGLAYPCRRSRSGAGRGATPLRHGAQRQRRLTTIWTEALLHPLLQVACAVVMLTASCLVNLGGHGWVRTNDPPLVRRVLFH